MMITARNALDQFFNAKNYGCIVKHMTLTLRSEGAKAVHCGLNAEAQHGNRDTMFLGQKWAYATRVQADVYEISTALHPCVRGARCVEQECEALRNPDNSRKYSGRHKSLHKKKNLCHWLVYFSNFIFRCQTCSLISS